MCLASPDARSLLPALARMGLRGLLLLRSAREYARVIDVPHLSVALRSMMLVSERPHWYGLRQDNEPRELP